jgi:hypothetical protein
MRQCTNIFTIYEEIASHVPGPSEFSLQCTIIIYMCCIYLVHQMESHLMSVTSIGVPSLPCWGGAPLGLSFSVLSNTVQGTIRGRVNTLQYTMETHITTKYEYIYCIPIEYQFGRPEKRPNTLSICAHYCFLFYVPEAHIMYFIRRC